MNIRSFKTAFMATALLAGLSGLVARGQSTTTDTALLFNKRYTRCENSWIAIPLNGQRNLYGYGFMYIDPVVGFSFNIEGYFSRSADGTYSKVKGITKNLRYTDPRRDDKLLVAIIPARHLPELNVIAVPPWLKIYNSYTDTLQHLSRWARFYNLANDHEGALYLLLKAYHRQPHAPAIELQLANTFAAMQNDAAEEQILVNALKTNPNDVILRTELGNLIVRQGDYQYGIECLSDALKLCDPNDWYERGRVALGLAIACQKAKDLPAYRQWINNAIRWSPKNSDIYQQAIALNQQY